jgi:hypothetical protein
MLTFYISTFKKHAYQYTPFWKDGRCGRRRIRPVGLSHMNPMIGNLFRISLKCEVSIVFLHGSGRPEEWNLSYENKTGDKALKISYYTLI